MNLAPSFERVDRFRIELQVADERLRAAQLANETVGALSAERSRLKPPAL